MTICTQNKVNYFGEIKKRRIQLSDIEQIATDCWQAISKHFRDTALDEFVVMPNHIHGILIFVGNADLRSKPLYCPQGQTDRSKMYLSKIIHGFKSSVTRIARKQWNNYSFGWQKSFYDHVIRNDADLHRVRTYIRNNPLNWESDRDNQINWKGRNADLRSLRRYR